jgi:hypothetical protein
METPEELKKWVDSLTMGEKRIVKVLGNARARTNGSQQLDLLEWLDKAHPAETLPPNASFARNMATVSDRLKDLILDGLHLLHKEDNVEAQLRAALDATALLYGKGLYPAALRTLRRAKKQALATSRYTFALQFLEWERKLVQIQAADKLFEEWSRLNAEEQGVLNRVQQLYALQHCHNLLLAKTRQVLIPRGDGLPQELLQFAEKEDVERIAVQGTYVEQALAVNILGIKNLFEGNPMAAFLRYERLLQEWRGQIPWQEDQGGLLLSICNFFQIACFLAPLEWRLAKHYLDLLLDFKSFSPTEMANFHRRHHLNNFTLALNTGNFESVRTLIVEMDRWLETQQKELTEAQVLPFLYNFAVAEFLQGNFAAANKMVVRILNMPKRKARQDIREFSLVLQAVLFYEMGETGLNEYLTRAGKRRFSKQAREVAFELAVFQYLDIAQRAESAAKVQAALANLTASLEQLGQVPGAPILGLMEMRFWAQSKRSGMPIKDVFLEAVKENLAGKS